MRDQSSSYVPHLLMTSLIAIWAGSFVAAKLAMQSVTPFALVASRFLLGSLCILPLFLRTTKEQRRGTLGPGILAGLVLAVPYFLQMYGVKETTASMGGFLTGMIVPLVAVGGAVFFGARIGKLSILGLLLGLGGIFTLCFSGAPDPDRPAHSSLLGILLQVGSTIGFAAHILLLSHYGKKLATAPFTFWQLAFTGAVATIGTAFAGVGVNGQPVQWTLELVLLISYLGVLATGVAIGVQARVQPKIKPTHVALLFALQPLFAAIAGWLFLGEQLDAMQCLGGALIVAGVIAAARDQA